MLSWIWGVKKYFNWVIAQNIKICFLNVCIREPPNMVLASLINTYLRHKFTKIFLLRIVDNFVNEKYIIREGNFVLSLEKNF